MSDNFVGPDATVPYLSQYDQSISVQHRYHFCGIVSLYMVVAYLCNQRQRQCPDLHTLSDHAIAIDGLDETEGWIQAKLAQTARDYGFEAMARSWFCRETDISYMHGVGRLDTQAETKWYEEQIHNEFIHTLQAVMEAGLPMILSVQPGFGSNNSNHLLVVAAYDPQSRSVRVHDPQYQGEEGRSVPVQLEYLLRYSNFNAIIVF